MRDVRVFIMFFVCCFFIACAKPEKTPCDGLAERKIGITPQEYSSCAGEILSTMDALQMQLSKMLFLKEKKAHSRAERKLRKLKTLIEKTGWENDRKEIENLNLFKLLVNPVRALKIFERWPDIRLIYLNNSIYSAYTTYSEVLNSQNVNSYQTALEYQKEAQHLYELSKKPVDQETALELLRKLFKIQAGRMGIWY